MTLLFMDGCSGGDYATKYSSVLSTNPVRATATPPVVGGVYYTMGNVKRTFTPSSEVIVHVRLRPASVTASTPWEITLYADSGAQGHVTITCTNTGFLQAQRGTIGGPVLATGTTNLLVSTWVLLEIRATIHDSTGIVQVRMNGSTSNEIDFTGDTKNAGTNTTFDAIQIIKDNAALDMADLAVFNTAGSVNNTWPGELTIQTLAPDGNGNTSDLLGSDADSTNNYLLVDELPIATADYVGSATTAQGDTYTMGNLTGSPTIRAIQASSHIGKSDGGTIFAKQRLRSGGTTYATGSKTPPGSGYATVTEIYETDPATAAAWTVANVNAVEAGIEVL